MSNSRTRKSAASPKATDATTETAPAPEETPAAPDAPETTPTDSSAAAEDGPQQVPPPADDQTPDAGDATDDAPGDDGGASEDANDEAAQRAAALANLAAGMDTGVEISPGGSEDAPAPSTPHLSGVEHEWGGPVRYVVLGYLFNAIVDGRHLTAYQGDVLHMTPEGAARGLEHRNIAPLD